MKNAKIHGSAFCVVGRSACAPLCVIGCCVIEILCHAGNAYLSCSKNVLHVTLILRDPVVFFANPTLWCPHREQQPVPRCLCCCLGTSMWRRREALVHLYAGAAAGVAGVLRGVQECPDHARACQQPNTRRFVVFPRTTQPAQPA